MSRETKAELEVSVSSLEEAIRTYKRDDVLALLKKDVLKEVPDDKKQAMYRKIASLRSIEMIDLIVKDEGGLSAADLALDTSNLNNRKFIQEVLKKFRKYLKMKDTDEAAAIFELACAAHDTATVKVMIKEGAAKDSWKAIAELPAESYAEIVGSMKAKLEAADTVTLFEATAKSSYADEKFEALSDAGFDFKKKNGQGKTISDILSKELDGSKSPKNKEEKLQRDRMKRAYVIVNPKPSSEKNAKKPMSRQTLIVLIVIAAAVAVTVIALILSSRSSSEEETADTDVELSDEIDSEAEEESSGGTVLSTDASLTIESGDVVNIDYTGYIDGEAFDGGSTDGYGTTLSIGSGAYIDGFEDQLIGHHPGEEVEVNVTFPETYSSEELAGKDATFEVTINGIYVDASEVSSEAEDGVADSAAESAADSVDSVAE